MNKTSLDKDKIKILLLEGVHPGSVENFKKAGYTNITYVKTALPESELMQELSNAHFVGIRSRTQLTAELFGHAKKLIGVGCFCIGTNQVDLSAAMCRGIPVFNAPYSNTRSVAELVLAQAILLKRKIPEKNAKAHKGIWDKSAAGSFEIRNKTLGIVGYGSIGSQLSVLAESMGMKVRFYDVVTKLPLGNAEQVESLEALCSQSDVLSLHVPDVESTRNLMAAKEFSWMKPGSIFINAARGTVVDIPALVQSLQTGHLAGAAIDVFPVEPRSNADEFISELRGIENVILTPHIGGSTVEAQENIGIEVSEKLIRYSDRGETLSSVNFPEVAISAHHSAHRLLHIHENIPGVLLEINKVFSENNINISSQFLQTKDTIGYVVMDVEAAYSELALQKLAAIKGTIRSRVLF